MSFEIAYTFENAQQFWDEVRDKVSSVSKQSEKSMVGLIGLFIELIDQSKGKFINSYSDFERCVEIYCSSPLAKANQALSQDCWISLLLSEDNNLFRALASHVLLNSAFSDSTGSLFLRLSRSHDLLPTLVTRFSDIDDHTLRQSLTKLMYEVIRRHPISLRDLDIFIQNKPQFLSQLIEDIVSEFDDGEFNMTSANQPDAQGSNMPYHSFGLVLVLNEQYLHYNARSGAENLLENPVIKFLSTYKRFNVLSPCIATRLNRERRADNQNLILQFLYSLFHSPETSECIYTTDLRVIVDIIIRNLFNMPFSETDVYGTKLRQLHLRVMLLIFLKTQLLKDEHPYLPSEIFRVLEYLTYAPSEANGSRDKSVSRPDSRSSAGTTKQPAPPPPRRANRLKARQNMGTPSPPPPAPPERTGQYARTLPPPPTPPPPSVSPPPPPSYNRCSDRVVPAASTAPQANTGEPTSNHFSPFELKTRALASRCAKVYDAQYPGVLGWVGGHENALDRLVRWDEETS